MPELISSLPIRRPTVKSKHHDLLISISDGKVYRIPRTDYEGKTGAFRLSVQSWARRRKLMAKTRVEDDGAVCVQMEPLT